MVGKCKCCKLYPLFLVSLTLVSLFFLCTYSVLYRLTVFIHLLVQYIMLYVLTLQDLCVLSIIQLLLRLSILFVLYSSYWDLVWSRTSSVLHVYSWEIYPTYLRTGETWGQRVKNFYLTENIVKMGSILSPVTEYMEWRESNEERWNREKEREREGEK